jgi:serine/threonine protein kinase
MLSEKAGYGSDWVHVLDFGIAAMANVDRATTNDQNENREIIGSPPYMSPEQCARLQSIDARSDIYSLAICLFEALSGTFPYRTRSAMEVIEGHLTGRPKLLRDVSMHTSTYESVTQLIQKALEKNPEKRHQTVKEFGEELEEAVAKDSKRGMALKDRVSMETPRVSEFVEVNKEVIDELDADEDLITTGSRRTMYNQKKKSIGNQLKQLIYGDHSSAGINKADDEKVAFFQCPHCGADTQRELSLCLCCGRSLAAKDDFSKLRVARGDFSLPKQHQPQTKETKAARRTKAAMVKTGRAWTRSMGLVFLSLLLVACVFVASGGYHLLIGALTNKPQPAQPNE